MLITENQKNSKDKQLYLERVNKFFNQVEDWLPQFKIIRTDINQDNTGVNKTPSLSIVKKDINDKEDNAVADLFPEGNSVLMGEGIIKINGPYGQESIIYMLKDGWIIQDRFGKERQMYQGIKCDGWYWLESSYRNIVHLVDKAILMDLLKMVSLYDQA